MLIFLKSFIDCSLLKKETIEFMLKHNNFETYNNMGTRYKGYLPKAEEVPSVCGGNSIVFSGYTGPMYIIDFTNKVIVVIMCNNMHNTRLQRIERKKITEEIMLKVCKYIYKK